MGETKIYVPDDADEFIEDNNKEISREEQSERLFRFLDLTNAEQFFDTDEHKKEFIGNLTYEDFTNLLLHINGILRDIPQNERTLFQKVGIVVPNTEGSIHTFIDIPTPSDFPRTEEKPELLKYAFNRSKELESPEDVGLVIGYAITAIHIFGDGNGRTSRLIYDLLSTNYTGSDSNKEFLRKALAEEGRFDTPNLDPTELLIETCEKMIYDEGYLTYNDEPLWFDFAQIRAALRDRGDLEDQEKETLLYLADRGNYDREAVRLSLVRYLKSSDQLDEYTKHLPEYRNERLAQYLPSRYVVDNDKFAANCNSNDIEGFSKGYWDSKRDMVKELVDNLVENRRLGNNDEPAREFARDIMSKWFDKVNRDRSEDSADPI